MTLPKTRYARSDDVLIACRVNGDGDNVGGTAVNVGARVMAQAEPGEWRLFAAQG